MKYLTEKEIEKLYKEFETPEHIKRHCKGVADTAVAIANALNDKGYNLDVKLIYCAGMCHDMARLMPDHGGVIASKLDELGYKEIADIVRDHMRYKGFEDLNKINETDILCLGDRTVKEDKYVGIDERIEYLIDKAGGTDEVRKRILAHKQESVNFINKVESITGRTLDDIVLNK